MNDNETLDFLAFGLNQHTGKKVKHKVNPDVTGEDASRLKSSINASLLSLVHNEDACVMLSGGIDSTAISRITGIDSVTASFPGTSMDEDRFARMASFSMAHKVTPTPSGILKDLPNVLEANKAPLGSIGVIAQWQVMEAATNMDYKIIVSGNGPDELFGGYVYYIGSYLKTLLLRGDIKLVKEILGLSGLKFPQPWAWISLLSNTIPDFIKERVVVDKLTALVDKDFAGDNDTGNYRKLKIGSVDKLLENDLNIATVPEIGFYEDNNAKSHGLKCERPFLSKKFVEYAVGLPLDQKIREGVTKYAFREALKGAIPEEIRQRRDKIGFTSPERELMTGALAKDMEAVFASQEFRQRELYAPDVLEDFQAFLKGENLYLPRQFWRCYAMEKWLQ